MIRTAVARKARMERRGCTRKREAERVWRPDSVRDEAELQERIRLLEEHGHKILSTKILDTPPVAIGEAEALSGGINLFNEERFWESHEVLESIWRVSEGSEKEALHSLILIAAAFVHFQKGEMDRAEKYIAAAWTLQQHGEVGYHLGQIFEKRGKNEEALHLYALAVVADRTVPAKGARVEAKGHIITGFVFSGRNMGTVLQESGRKAKDKY